jgi:hypothetical protein
MAQSFDGVFRLGIASLAVVTSGDIATTAIASKRGGFRELNPLGRLVYDRPVLMGVVNGAATVGVGLLIADIHPRHPKFARTLLWTWVLVRGAVVVRNVQQLRR